MKKATIRDLAVALNLSCSAVSAALNKRPNISAGTQERVRKMADKMGYATDARITQLMSYLRTGKGSRNAPNLAWLHWATTSDEHETKPWRSGYLAGAKNRANQLGYAIDPIWLNSPQFPPHRLNSVFQARGIEGLIVVNACWPCTLDNTLQWSKFAVASLEGTVGDPGLPHVGSLGIHSLQTIFENLLRLGYRSPGLVIGRWINNANACQLTAGFLQQQRQLPEAARIPILESDVWPTLLAEWMKAHRPDVIICAANETIDHIRSLGLNVPTDVAVVHLNLRSDVSGWAGIDQLHEQIGSAAVDVVTAHLNRGDCGLSAYPKYIYIRGVWVEGWTCPPRTVQ